MFHNWSDVGYLYILQKQKKKNKHRDWYRPGYNGKEGHTLSETDHVTDILLPPLLQCHPSSFNHQKGFHIHTFIPFLLDILLQLYPHLTSPIQMQQILCIHTQHIHWTLANFVCCVSIIGSEWMILYKIQYVNGLWPSICRQTFQSSFVQATVCICNSSPMTTLGWG